MRRASDYYVAGQKLAPRGHPLRNFLLVLAIILALLAAASYAFIRFTTSPDHISNAPGATSTVHGSPTRHFQEATFAFDAPKDWKLERALHSPFTQYTYHATKKHASNRTLNIYVDYVPPDMTLNRIIPLKANGKKLTLGPTSPDCKSLKPGANQTATWHHVSFPCDTTSVNRNALGTNAVQLAGHRYFFLYIDHNIHPKDRIFTGILQSFRAR